MDVKAAREKFAKVWPEFQRKQVEMEMAKQDMNKKYVEMHLIYKKYLIDEEHDAGALAGTRMDLYNILK